MKKRSYGGWIVCTEHLGKCPLAFSPAEVTTASEAQEEKTLFKSKAQQSLATAKTDLEEAESTLAEDVKYKKDLILGAE